MELLWHPEHTHTQMCRIIINTPDQQPSTSGSNSKHKLLLHYISQGALCFLCCTLAIDLREVGQTGTHGEGLREFAERQTGMRTAIISMCSAIILQGWRETVAMAT